MVEFFQTVMGRKFYDHDVPELVRGINRLANAIEKQNELLEKQTKADDTTNSTNGGNSDVG